MFENLGIGEILLVVLVLLFLFGGKKIPEIAQGLGKGIREFRKAVRGEDEEEPKKIDDKSTKEK